MTLRFESYARGSEIDHFAWWVRTYLIQSTGSFANQALELELWELEFMGEALAVADGPGGELTRLWRSVVLVVSRKNGKTALLAAYALYRLFNDADNPEILLAAASDKNAGRLFEAVTLYARKNPELSTRIHIREYVGEIVRKDGLGKIIRLATDPTVLHGYNPSLVICDELHAWTKPSLRKVWTALTTGGGAREMGGNPPQVFTITTAGEAASRATSILGRLIDGNEGAAATAGTLEKHPGLTISRNYPGQTLVYNYCAPTLDPKDLSAIKLANPASWITMEYLSRQAHNPELSASEMLQYHGCVWAKGEMTWIDPALIAELAKPRDLAELAKSDLDVVLAFDGSYARDSTMLIGATVEKHPYVWVERAWERPADDPNWRTPRNDVMAAIEDAMETYNVVEFAPDPPGWHREIEELEETYGEVVVRFETNQPRRMGPACDDFEQAILGPGLEEADDELDEPIERGDPELEHDGSEVLMRHLSNCVPVRRAGYTVVTKESHDSPLKIDAAIGAIVAYHRARWLYTNQEEDMGAIVIETGKR